MYSVTSESGETYLVDPELPGCECPDFEYRDRIYKHLRRVAFATGRREMGGAEGGPVDMSGIL